jgi:hypothetical protein
MVDSPVTGSVPLHPTPSRVLVVGGRTGQHAQALTRGWGWILNTGHALQANWGFIVFGGAVGSLSFGAIYGQVYESQTPAGCDECKGSHCYRTAFVISSVLLLVGIAACGTLAKYGSKRVVG